MTINSSSNAASTRALRQPALSSIVQRYATLGGSWAAWLLGALDATIFGFTMLAIASTFSVGLGDVISTVAWLLFATGIDGLFLGNIADRIGRKKTILMPVFIYGTGTLLCGFVSNVLELSVYRFCVGVAVGGLWSTASALVPEIWTSGGRAKAIAFMQTGWSSGGLLTTCFAWTLLDPSNPDSWRKFFIYVSIPAYMAFVFVLLFVKELPVQLANRTYKAKHAKKSSLFEVSRPAYLKMTLLGPSVSISGVYGYQTTTTFTPTYLQSILHVRMDQVPMFLIWAGISVAIGYLVCGQLAGLIGRYKLFVLFFLGMAIIVSVFTYDAALMLLADRKLASTTRNIVVTDALAALLGFFTSRFSGFGAWYSELFPTSICSTAAGFCFNFGRAGTIPSIKLTPILIPLIGFTATVSLASVFYLIASAMIFLLQKAKGVRLTSDN